MKSLKGKKVIITGAAQGLGLAMAEGLCEYGAEICILDISPNLKSVIEKLSQKGYKVNGITVDLFNREDNVIAFKEAVRILDNELDVLINNAGIHKPMQAFDLPIEDFQRIMDINVTAVFQLSQLAGHEMRKKGKGKIINIASVLSTLGGFNASAYSASKGAITQLTKSLSNEWAKEGINVNAIAPGYFNTEFNRFIIEDKERYASLVSRIPAGRFGNSEELTGTIQFLASDKSDYITGTVIPVDGGFLGR